ncbi:cytochrome P460 family protein [Sphingomonas sp. AR_OL41]|uniref:cytochrome P460 family protein n=1 Tax=Sphingomonas sp. AR_OL41 TaxID=3042729 RepID=UPI002480F479|nr:cytochrome P460 family protein [Sphingomonas sp. AR_OL41]MDH7972854.1 cytochrome P460 family protein [Sphingomonas sp. AR_OL41]
MRGRYGRFATASAIALSLCAVTGAAVQQAPNASPVYGVRLPAGYRDWQVVSVAHEAGGLNDIRVILGNDVAMRAYRTGKRLFPDGTMLARIAWKLVPSARNDAVFGKPQSFVAGDPTNVQILLKDATKFPATEGWGYGQFENGRANPDQGLIRTCYPCHARLPASEDLVFTAYAR